MKATARWWIPALLLLGGWLVFHSREGAIDYSEYRRFEAGLTRLKEAEATLSDDVLQARFDLLTDYDTFSATLDELRQATGTLGTLPAFILPEKRAAFANKLGDFTQLLGQKERLIESFKSHNAVLNNSLRYLPNATTQVLAELAQDGGNVDLEAQLNGLMQGLLIYCLNPGEEHLLPIRESLANLAEWLRQNPAHPHVSPVRAIAAHGASILAHKPKIEALTQAIVSLPTHACALELGALDEAGFANAVRLGDRSRQVLSVGCALLLLGIGYAIFLLAAAKRDLERRVEERTRELSVANQRFELVIKATRDVIWDWDTDSQTMWWNENVTTLFGYPSVETGTKLDSWTKRLHPDDAPAVLASIESAIRTERPVWSSKYRFRRYDGTYAWVIDRACLLRDASGLTVRMTGAMQDITARVQAENHLRLSDLSIRAVSQGVLVADAHQRTLSVNPAFVSITGYDESEFLGRKCLFLQGADTDPKTLKAIHDAMLTGSEFSGEILNYRKDGAAFWNELTITSVRDAEGQVSHFICVSRDITARKESEAKNVELNKALVDTSRMAGMAEVATSVLHNVGNVLNSVNVSATVVAEALMKSERASLAKVVALLRQHDADLGSYLSHDVKGKQIVGFLEALATHLAAEHKKVVGEITELLKNIDHIKDVVSMQQSYAGVSGVTEKLNIADLLEDTLRMHGESLSKHDFEVVREFATVPEVTVDKHKLLQLLVNLIRNAKEACDAAKPAQKRLTLRVANGGGQVKISVSDNGVGIPPENLNRIFSHGFTTKKEGHGFGLHSGALAAREMGGALLVSSEGTGRGATFTVELPLLPPANSNS